MIGERIGQSVMRRDETTKLGWVLAFSHINYVSRDNPGLLQT